MQCIRSQGVPTLLLLGVPTLLLLGVPTLLLLGGRGGAVLCIPCAVIV